MSRSVLFIDWLIQRIVYHLLAHGKIKCPSAATVIGDIIVPEKIELEVNNPKLHRRNCCGLMYAHTLRANQHVNDFGRGSGGYAELSRG